MNPHWAKPSVIFSPNRPESTTFTNLRRWGSLTRFLQYWFTIHEPRTKQSKSNWMSTLKTSEPSNATASTKKTIAVLKLEKKAFAITLFCLPAYPKSSITCSSENEHFFPKNTGTNLYQKESSTRKVGQKSTLNFCSYGTANNMLRDMTRINEHLHY